MHCRILQYYADQLHLNTMRYKYVSFFLACGVLAFVCATQQRAHANYRVTGLEQHKTLQEYISDKVDHPEEHSVQNIVQFKSQIRKAARAQGFYDVQVYEETFTTEDANIRVEPRRQYTIGKITVKGYDVPFNLDIETGQKAIASKILESQKRLRNYIFEHECFYNLSVTHEAYIDRINHTIDIAFIVSGTNGVSFGNARFEGNKNIKQSYLQNHVEFQSGNCWKGDLLDETKNNLLSTGLIASVKIDTPETVPADKIVPLNIVISERAPRSVKLGAFFNTNEGPGVTAQWQHNNYRGAGETLRFETRLSPITQSLGMGYDIPFFLNAKQTLSFDTSLNQEDTDIYEETSFESGLALSRQFTKDFNASIGAGLEFSEVTDEDDDEDVFGLVSSPLKLSYDNRDNPLNPHEGVLLQVNTTPFFDILGEASPFLKSQISGSTYFDLSSSKTDPVLAVRGLFGNISGSGRSDIPASKRFYTGGGGSIRGFGYQDVGPQDSEGDFIGGRSIIETSAEIRFNVSENIGLVSFVDAGNVYENISPEFGEGFAVGAGLGVRYYTSFGPIRFDVAVPVNKKEITDDRFQIYISIGQSF